MDTRCRTFLASSVLDGLSTAGNRQSNAVRLPSGAACDDCRFHGSAVDLNQCSACGSRRCLQRYGVDAYSRGSDHDALLPQSARTGLSSHGLAVKTTVARRGDREDRWQVRCSRLLTGRGGGLSCRWSERIPPLSQRLLPHPDRSGREYARRCNERRREGHMTKASRCLRARSDAARGGDRAVRSEVEPGNCRGRKASECPSPSSLRRYVPHSRRISLSDEHNENRSRK